jgi:hypothetical protein
MFQSKPEVMDANTAAVTGVVVALNGWYYRYYATIVDTKHFSSFI